MQIAFIHARSRGGADDTLRSVAATLRSEGHRLAGVMPEPCTAPDRHACDMDLIDLASGARLNISQKLGQHSTGCRLDGAAIEAAAMVVANGLGAARLAPDLMMLNRFGKQEATGHGFHPVIVSALERAVPVLLGVNDLNRPAFETFAAGLAVELPEDPDVVLVWIARHLRQHAA
ncbi:nucleoside-triphosphatase THEP1 [Roseovarius sp. MBR-154]|jgi:nucleoside-triphosphatase THEP1